MSTPGEVDQVDELLRRRVHLQRWPVHRHGAAVTLSFAKNKQINLFLPSAVIDYDHGSTIIFSPPSCDQTSNCIDESDEDNCKLLSMKVRIKLLLFYLYCSSCQDNYNKKIAPFSFDKVLKAVIPVKINVSISVIDILRIKEVDHIYVLKFRLVLEWWTQ